MPVWVCQVSTFTPARSSPWARTEVRRMNFAPAAHRPRTSQLDVRPLPVLPRAWTSIQLFPGVRASHEAISSVRSNPGVRHGDRHWATSYLRPA